MRFTIVCMTSAQRYDAIIIGAGHNGLTGGNIFHGEMSRDQLFSFRPLAGWARYRTPVPGVWLCGSGTHPGGGVMGLPGRNAVFEILNIPGYKFP